ncbi:hypothetical protein [Pseudonocardia sp. NPDC049635]|uniref:hypothetical protein n=1 Tax=Pseudonocardia sp. NPDC049635 TaxID=3155506 RepID=UPI0033D384A3
MTADPTGTRKTIERVGLGAWFQVNDDGTPTWVCCHAVLRGKIPATGQKVTELRGATADGELISFVDLDNSPIQALTKREAKAAGLVDPRTVAAGDAR